MLIQVQALGYHGKLKLAQLIKNLIAILTPIFISSLVRSSALASLVSFLAFCSNSSPAGIFFTGLGSFPSFALVAPNNRCDIPGR